MVIGGNEIRFEYMKYWKYELDGLFVIVMNGVKEFFLLVKIYENVIVYLIFKGLLFLGLLEWKLLR